MYYVCLICMYVIQDPHANREKINQDLTSKHRITSYIVRSCRLFSTLSQRYFRSVRLHHLGDVRDAGSVGVVDISLFLSTLSTSTVDSVLVALVVSFVSLSSVVSLTISSSKYTQRPEAEQRCHFRLESLLRFNIFHNRHQIKQRPQ